MSIHNYSVPSDVRRWVAYAAMLLGLGAVWAQPSQSPLLSRSGGGVSPNVVLDLDDSGSMLYQHMPENSFVLGGKTVTLGGDRGVVTHPSDTRKFSNNRGVYPADTGATGTALNYQQLVRSPDINTLYYNPETTYLPWIKSDGTRFPAAVPAAAQFDPMVTATTEVTFVGAGTAGIATSGNVTPTLPSGWAANDLLICLAESFDLVDHTTSSVGWTRIYNLKGSATHSASAFYKIAGASESNPVLSHTGGAGIVAQCFAYRGVDTVQPFDVPYAGAASATSNTTSDSTIDTGSVTTVTANTMILMTSHQANDFGSLNVTTAGGLTWAQSGRTAYNPSGSNNDVGIGLHYATKTAIGAVGPLVVTSNQAERNSGALLVLRKGSSAPVTSGGVNLLVSTSTITANWCFTSSDTACSSSSRSYTPMLFYRLKKAAGAYMDPTVTANFDSYDLTNDLKNGAAGAAPQTYPTRTDCTATVCSLTQERQNYANWYVYHRSRLLVAQGAIAESFWNMDETKLRVGWGSIHKDYTVVDNGESVATVISGVRKFTAARKDALFDFARNITVQSGTPLRSALWGVGEYYTQASPWADDPGNMAFSDPVGSAPKDCRRAYHLLITDGLWNTTGAPFSKTVGNFDGGAPSGSASLPYEKITTSGNEYTYEAKAPYADSNSDTLADFASYFFNRDLRSTLANNAQPSPPAKQFWQGMVNFTVGIGLKGTLDPATDLPFLTNGTKTWGTDKVDDLWHAAVNSEGSFFSAKNSSELAGALASALTTTTQNELREAGVATSSSVLEDGNRKYIPFYKSGAWTGDIRAFELDANGLTKVGPGLNGELWSAGSKLPAWNLRNIFTWNSSANAPSSFTWAAMGALNQAAIGPDAGSSALVDYLRGDATNEVTAALPLNPYRARATRLGDFINSNPVLVKSGTDLGYQSLTVGGSSYNTYRTTTKATRHGVLFVGANDGMVHAFKDTQGAVPADDGKEIFAYVPRAVYPSLSVLSDKDYGTTSLYHQFFVDGAFSETDAYVKATAASSTATWRNYLVGSLGAGGRAVLAFDVTDMTLPGASNVKWEFSKDNDGDLGYVSAPIEVGVLPNGTWVAIFGNGPFSDAGKAVLFVLNLETGVATKLEVDGVTASNGLGGVGVQRDASGYITNLFVGDLNGAMWKLDYDAAAVSPTKFVVSGGQRFFNAKSSGLVAQPITQAPLIYDHSLGGKLVVFATGKLLVEADRDTTGTQSMYAVWDKTADTVSRPMDRASLEPRQLLKVVGKDGAIFYGLSGNAVNWTGVQRGWVIDLTLNDAGTDLLLGQRVIYPPQKVSTKLALISTVAPAGQTAVCTAATGLGANFLLPVEDGLNPTYKLFDVNGDGVFNSSDAYVVGYATNVDGIDSVIKSPSGSLTAPDGACDAGFQRTSIQSTTGQVMACIEIPSPPGTSIRDRIWRRIINPPIR
ncbi:MAG: pilus assembly protein [Burkholderiales bacterium]